MRSAARAAAWFLFLVGVVCAWCWCAVQHMQRPAYCTEHTLRTGQHVCTTADSVVLWCVFAVLVLRGAYWFLFEFTRKGEDI